MPHQPLPLQGRRAQFVNQQAHLLERLLSDFANPAQVFGGMGHVARAHLPPPPLRQKTEAVQRLGDRIAQIAGQAVALLQDSQFAARSIVDGCKSLGSCESLQSKIKGAAPPHLAIYPHLPTQLFHNVARNRKPQAMPFGAIFVNAGKGCEQPGLILG